MRGPPTSRKRLQAITEELEQLSLEVNRLPTKKRIPWVKKKRGKIRKLFHRMVDEVIEAVCNA